MGIPLPLYLSRGKALLEQIDYFGHLGHCNSSILIITQHTLFVNRQLDIYNPSVLIITQHTPFVKRQLDISSCICYNRIVMNATVIATVIEEGAKLACDIIRHSVIHARSRQEKPHEVTQHEVAPHAGAWIETIQQEQQHESPIGNAPVESSKAQAPVLDFTKSYIPEHASGEREYRLECCVKHLGGASVLLREAFERANDEGMGEGTAEKVIEAMNEHSAMETDLEKMLDAKDVKDVTERLLSGARQFRASAWKSGLPRGDGTKDDIEAARMWNNILLNETITAAHKFPGTKCQEEGM